jgi:serine protease Do
VTKGARVVRRWVTIAAVGWIGLNAAPACARAEPAGAAERVNDELRYARSLSNAFKSASSRIEPSVVHITSRRLVRNVQRDVFGRTVRRGPSRLEDAGLGSGVIIDASGIVLTNHHVIEGADALVVRLSDEREYEAELVGSDPATDVAVLRIDAENLVAAPFGDSESIEVGEWVLAIGSPFGFDRTVTAGIISAKGRSGIGGDDADRFQEFLQTDASINPGNSGGPLITLDGEVVGINTAIASRGGGSVGIGFAIPAAMARSVMGFILENGRVERGWLGVGLADVTPAIADELGLGADAARGVLVTGVEPGSPAAEAGLAEGDVIIAFGGRDAENLNRLRNLIALTPPGEAASVRVVRDRASVDLVARLINRDVAQSRLRGGVYIPSLDAAVRDLDDRTARQLGYRRAFPGAVLVFVDPQGPAGAAGLVVGDVITQIDERRVETAREVVERIDVSPGTARINIVRGRVRGHVDIELE